MQSSNTRLLLSSWGLGLWAVVQLSGCAMPAEQLAYRQRLEAGVQTPEDTVRFKTSREEQQQLVVSVQDWPQADASRVGAELLKAASAGDLGATKAAILAGARVNASNEWGSTPVLLAAQQGQVDVVRTLLRAGAWPDGRGGAMTPLAAAALGGHTEVVKLLLNSGAKTDTSTESGESALVLAVRNPEPSVTNPYAYRGSQYTKGGPELIANPGGDVQVIPGQLMVVLGSKEQLARFRTLLGAAVVEESPMIS